MHRGIKAIVVASSWWVLCGAAALAQPAKGDGKQQTAETSAQKSSGADRASAPAQKTVEPNAQKTGAGKGTAAQPKPRPEREAVEQKGSTKGLPATKRGSAPKAKQRSDRDTEQVSQAKANKAPPNESTDKGLGQAEVAESKNNKGTSKQQTLSVQGQLKMNGTVGHKGQGKGTQAEPQVTGANKPAPSNGTKGSAR